MILIPALLCILASSPQDIHLSNDQQDAVLTEAQNAYDNAVLLQTSDPVASKDLFRRAANRYQLLVDDGIENGKLWYNLGNAQLQVGEIGEAIAAYRSSQRYMPSDGRLQANLEYARTLVTNPITAKGTSSILKRLAFWHESLPTQVRLGVGITFWFACWALVSVRLFRRVPGFKTISISLGCIALSLGVSVGIDISDQYQNHGVLTAKEVIVRKGNGLSYAPMLKDPLHEGIEFDIIQQRPDWLHIKLPNGSTGWIQEEDAQIVTLDLTLTERL
jgi:tetratricopeptide (TPR) repeat protein